MSAKKLPTIRITGQTPQEVAALIAAVEVGLGRRVAFGQITQGRREWVVSATVAPEPPITATTAVQLTSGGNMHRLRDRSTTLCGKPVPTGAKLSEDWPLPSCQQCQRIIVTTLR